MVWTVHGLLTRRASSTRYARYAVLLASIIGALPAVSAADLPGDRALARAQQFLRQLAAEKKRLEAENAKLSADNRALTDNLERAKRAFEKAETLVTRYQESNLGYKERLAQTEANARETRTRLQQSVAKYRDTLGRTQQALQQSEATGVSLNRTLEEQRKAYAVAEQKNLKLYEANVELLGRYEDKGIFDMLLQAEPVTGLKEVELENLLQDYRDKLDEQRLAPAGAANR